MVTTELVEGHKPIAPPAGVPVWDVDPYDAATLADPSRYYDELRHIGPFAYIPRYSALVCGRYDVAKEVFSDHTRFLSSRGIGLTDFSLDKPWRPPSIILEADPPEHTKTRRVMARAMSPGAVARLREEFQREAEALIDRVLARGRIEGVTEIAEAYSGSVFPRAVGLRNIDVRKLVDYGAMVFNAVGPDNQLRRAAMAKGPLIVPWITAQCERENLEPTGLGSDIYAAADTGELSPQEAAMLVRSLLSAGVDTTVTGIGSALWALATNPDQFAKLKADPSHARNAFDETLRLTSPVHTFCRTAGLDTEVAGTTIPEGAKILCVLGAANLDPVQWPAPDRFDITRRATGHLAFGVGIHGCVGQNIARAEGEAILQALAQRVTRLELDGPAVWRPNNAMHALDRLPLKLS